MLFRIKLLLLLFLGLNCLFMNAQDLNIDSLKKFLQQDLNDTSRIKALDQLSHQLMRTSDLKEAEGYANQALEIANKTEEPKWISSAYNSLGNLASSKSDHAKALEYHQKALSLRESINDQKGIAASYNNIGVIYFDLSDYTKAIDYMQKALKIQEQLGNKYFVAACIGNIAVLYDKLGDDSLALVYQKKSYHMHKEMGNKTDMIASMNHLGSLYRVKKDYAQSETYLRRALQIMNGSNDKKGESETRGNIGLLYCDMGRYEDAIVELEKGLEISKEIAEKKLMTEQFSLLGKANKALGKNGVAMAYYKTAYTLAKETGSLENQQGAAKGLYEVYKANGNVADALKYHELLTDLNDSIHSATKNAAFNNLKTQFALDRQEHELKSKAKEESDKQEAEAKQQRFVGYIIIFVLVLVMLFSYFLYQRFRVISSQKKIIEEQKEQMEVKNKDITDSINYAKRIQEAVIPDMALKEKMFPDSFIFFRPRDIVSGDFYWFSEKNGRKLITAVDCTGHGVPGAFMSMIGNAFLNEVVNEKGITMPGEILSQLRHRVIQALRQTGAKGEQRDGMDISLLSVSSDNKKADWAGANNPLWLVRGGEVIEYKPNKRPIGYFLGNGLPFDNHHIDLEKGDALYILTDGFADQFGGPKGKKFKYSQLKKLLISMQHMTMAEQEAVLTSTFIEWKNELEQIDDVCLIGIKI